MNISPPNILRLATSRLLVLFALFACALLPVHAASLDDLGYTTTDGEVTITDCDEAATGELVIPPTIEGNPVTSIGELAFGNCFSLTNITLPDSVVSIENQAFTQCFSLTSITVPDSVTRIGVYAFRSCTSLTSVTIGDGVTSIDNWAFLSCIALTSVTIPDSVKSVGWNTFYGCTKLTSITFLGTAPQRPISSEGLADGIIAYVTREALSSFGAVDDDWNGFSIQLDVGTDLAGPLNYVTYDGEVIITRCNTSASGELVIPGTIEEKPVTSIEYDAFAECSRLTGITIPDNVASIGNAAFRSCIKLTKIAIPGGVTTIGEEAFRGCASLTSITFGTNSKLTGIGDYTFTNCTNLTSIAIPDSVSSIGIYAFSNCAGLTSITFGPNSKLTGIGDYTFTNCTNLTSIAIPDSVSSIGIYAFSNCASLTSITFGTSSKLTGIGDYTFTNCTNLTGIKIPDGVTSIGRRVFQDCSGLTNITISDSVTTIWEEAFLNCTSLTRVTIPKNVTRIGAKAFYDLPNLSSVYFSGNSPSIGLEAFDLAANGFAVYFNQDSRGFSSPAWKGYTAYSYAAPKFTSSPPAGSAFVNAPYSHTCNATGTPSATFMVTEGFLPDGLTLSSEGLISGSPVAVGTFTGKITATNGFLEGVTQNFSIQVRDGNTNPAPLPEIRTAIEFSFDAVNGVSYRIEASTDLINWEMIETAIIGEGIRIDRFYSTRDQPNRHFRVKTN